MTHSSECRLGAGRASGRKPSDDERTGRAAQPRSLAMRKWRAKRGNAKGWRQVEGMEK